MVEMRERPHHGIHQKSVSRAYGLELNSLRVDHAQRTNVESIYDASIVPRGGTNQNTLRPDQNGTIV